MLTDPCTIIVLYIPLLQYDDICACIVQQRALTYQFAVSQEEHDGVVQALAQEAKEFIGEMGEAHRCEMTTLTAGLDDMLHTISALEERLAQYEASEVERTAMEKQLNNKLKLVRTVEAADGASDAELQKLRTVITQLMQGPLPSKYKIQVMQGNGWNTYVHSKRARASVSPSNSTPIRRSGRGRLKVSPAA